jgi:tetratricopeptide (TPR) repeat protein
MAAAIPMTEAMPSGPAVIMSNSSGLMGAARIFVEADKMDRALAIYGPDYLKKNIDKPGVAAGYASFWARQNKNLASALEAAKKAVELTPDNFSIWNTLSQINLNLKKYDDALKAAEKAVETAPNEQLKNIYRKQIDQIKAAAQEKK